MPDKRECDIYNVSLPWESSGMCLKTFGRFCANIEVVPASRIKVYEYIRDADTYMRGLGYETMLDILFGKVLGSSKKKYI